MLGEPVGQSPAADPLVHRFDSLRELDRLIEIARKQDEVKRAVNAFYAGEYLHIPRQPKPDYNTPRHREYLEQRLRAFVEKVLSGQTVRAEGANIAHGESLERYPLGRFLAVAPDGRFLQPTHQVILRSVYGKEVHGFFHLNAKGGLRGELFEMARNGYTELGGSRNLSLRQLSYAVIAGSPITATGLTLPRSA